MPIIEITDYDRRVYEEKLADFLPERFIDCHTHIWQKGTRKVGDKCYMDSDCRSVSDI